jgi:hypothetical protein
MVFSKVKLILRRERGQHNIVVAQVKLLLEISVAAKLRGRERKLVKTINLH